jgi:hypothetical protein
MITPPFSICARPFLTANVAVCCSITSSWLPDNSI